MPRTGPPTNRSREEGGWPDPRIELGGHENRHIGEKDPSSSLPHREHRIDRQQDETQDHGRIGVSYVLCEEDGRQSRSTEE